MQGRTAAAAGIALLLVAITGAAIYGVLAKPTPSAHAPGVPSSGRPPAEAGSDTPSGSGRTAKTAEAGVASAALAEIDPLITNGQFSRAEALLAAAIEKSPEDQELRTAMARALIGQKKWDDAYRHLEAAVAIGPDAAALRSMAGTVAHKARKYDLAVEHFSKAESLEPAVSQHPLFLAQSQIRAGQEPAATASLFRALKIDPDLHEAWGTLAQLALKNNQLEMTLQYAEKARALSPNFVEWRLVEARARKRLGEPQKAIDLLVNLPEKDRYRDDVLQQLAECYGLLKQPEKAAALYQSAAKARPDAAETLTTQAENWRSK